MTAPARFAAGTDVPPERTRMEIETFVRRQGADAFMVAGDAERHVIQFRIKRRVVRFTVVVPPLASFKPAKLRPRESGNDARARLRAAEDRRLWRALLLVLKAKFESVASGITSFDHEFLAHLVTGTGETVGDQLAPRLETMLTSDAPMPALALPAGGG